MLSSKQQLCEKLHIIDADIQVFQWQSAQGWPNKEEQDMQSL